MILKVTVSMNYWNYNPQKLLDVRHQLYVLLKDFAQKIMHKFYIDFLQNIIQNMLIAKRNLKKY